MEQLDNYLLQLKKLADIKHDPLTFQNALTPLIDQQTWAEGNPAYEQFFIAERLYYEGQYEKALEHYLEAKGIPLYQFFCYRATCQLLHSRGQTEQAIGFAEKALQIDPTDPFLTVLVQAGKKSTESPKVFDEEFSSDESLADLNSNIDLLSPYEQTMESSMNSGSGIFSSTPHTDAAASESLTERLYSFKDQPPIPPLASEQHNNALYELRKLAGSESRNGNFRSTMVKEFEGSSALEERMLDFHKRHNEQMRAYLDLTQRRTKLQDNCLYIFNGWNVTGMPLKSESTPYPLLLTEESRKSQGGHYIRWNGKGIVVNPGPGFIKNFHDQGLCIRDIDFVIVTRNSPEAYEDIKIISELNSQLNKMSSDLQMIHYYLHHKARQELAAFLRPSFKQARHTIHNLEMFLDSPDVERIELDEGITLHYFLSTSLESLSNSRNSENDSHAQSALGIKLELYTDEKEVNIGYISGMCWSPLLAHHLSHCDLLLAGFGNTNPRDYSKLGYNDDSLGYHGSYALFEEVAPKLTLLTEFGGRDGDIRLEVIRKIRQDILKPKSASTNEQHPILPADIGLIIDLYSLQVKCTMSQKDVLPSELCVVAPTGDFGRLNYLSSSYCI